MIAYEDAQVGHAIDLGQHTFDADDIKRFAGAYDPQPFHLDEAAADAGPFGGLCASGWHTAAVWMSLMVRHIGARMAEAEARGEAPLALGPSPGFENLRWTRPVYAGDMIHYSSTIADKRRSATRSEWGLLTLDSKAVNQDGITVMTFRSRVFVPVRRNDENGTDGQ
ncbi:MAG: dehydratase [Hyphomicrobiales bacterium]|nr:MAG: dehydratase [Hyphomicrobiales bacterium]